MSVSRMTLRGAATGRALAAAIIGMGFACVLALVWFPQPAQATYPGRNGSILFERGDSNPTNRYYEISIGGRPQLVIPPDRASGLSGAAAVDRAGTHLAIPGDAMYLAPLDRPALVDEVDIDITEDGGVHDLTWSPDGRRLAIEEHDGLVTVNRRGRELADIGSGASPSWSSRGQLVYSTIDGLMVVRPDNPASKPKLIRGTSLDDLDADWSPDGRRLAVTRGTDRSDRPGTKLDVWVMNADGSGARHLRAGCCARWSPDGQSIVYDGGDHDDPDSVWVMSASGGHPRRIAQGYSPAWLPATK